MAPELHIYSKDLDANMREYGINPPDMTTGEPARISSQILSLYQAGEALFSKESLRDISQQLKSGSSKVSVRGINGDPVDFEIQIGQTYDSGDPDYDFLIGEPLLFYHSLQHLTVSTWAFIPHLAYCSIWIFHNIYKRNRLTHELLPTSPILSFESVSSFFHEHRSNWESSSQRQLLSSILSTHALPHIDKIIAFSCGRMSFHDECSWEERSAYQHSLIITLRDILTSIQQSQSHPDNNTSTSNGSKGEIKCFAQDPIYTPHDIETLNTSGISVLSDPDGFLEIDEFSAVLSFSSDMPIRQIVADVGKPAMMIWDRVEILADGEINPKKLTSDPTSPRLSNLIQTSYDTVDFPGCLDAFGDNEMRFACIFFSDHVQVAPCIVVAAAAA